MNTHGLSQLYDQLTPSERLPLIMAAAARDDEAEKQRLSAAAPEVSFRVPNYYPLAKALSEAVDYHLLTLLDLAAQFWQWWGIWMSYLGRHSSAGNPKTGRRRKTDADRLPEWRARGIARYFASRFVAHRHGWKQSCSAMNIDSEVQLEQLRAEMVLRTAGMLTGAGMGAVKVLVELQNDAAQPAAVRRRSARDVLEMGLKFREIAQLEQRLAAIEAQMAGVPGLQLEQPPVHHELEDPSPLASQKGAPHDQTTATPD